MRRFATRPHPILPPQAREGESVPGMNRVESFQFPLT